MTEIEGLLMAQTAAIEANTDEVKGLKNTISDFQKNYREDQGEIWKEISSMKKDCSAHHLEIDPIIAQIQVKANGATAKLERVEDQRVEGFRFTLNNIISIVSLIISAGLMIVYILAVSHK